MNLRSLLVVALAPITLSFVGAAQQLPWEERLRTAWSAHQQGKFAEAEAILLAAAREAESSPGVDDRLPRSLNELALFYDGRNRSADAVPVLIRLLGVLEARRGKDHPDVAATLNSLGLSYRNVGKPVEAKQALSRAVAILGKAQPENPDTALAQVNLAKLCVALNQQGEAATWLAQALGIRERVFGPQHASVAETAFQLATALTQLGQSAEAELHFRRSLVLREKLLGASHPDTLVVATDLGGLLLQLDRLEEAEAQFTAVRKALEARFGPEHVSVAMILVNLGSLRRAQRRPDEAEELYRKALALFAGAGHPNPGVEALAWNNLASMCWGSGRLPEAATHYQRALTTLEALHGSDAPMVANVLQDYAGVLSGLGRVAESKALLERVAAIRAKGSGRQVK